LAQPGAPHAAILVPLHTHPGALGGDDAEHADAHRRWCPPSSSRAHYHGCAEERRVGSIRPGGLPQSLRELGGACDWAGKGRLHHPRL